MPLWMMNLFSNILSAKVKNWKLQSLELQSVKQPLPLKKEQIQNWLKCSTTDLQTLKQTENSKRFLINT